MSKLRASLIIFLLLLTACTGPTAENLATLKIGITPNLTSIKPEIHRCASNLPIHVFQVEQPFNTLFIKDLDAIIHVGTPPLEAGFSTQIGKTKLAIILNSGNPISTIEASLLKSILTGKITDWQAVSPGDFSSPTPIQVWSYPDEDDVRKLVEDGFLKGIPISPFSRFVPDGQAMVAAVMADPSAIGFITELTSHDQVHIVDINSADAFNLAQPILASLSKIPEGDLKLLLACLADSAD